MAPGEDSGGSAYSERFGADGRGWSIGTVCLVALAVIAIGLTLRLAIVVILPVVAIVGTIALTILFLVLLLVELPDWRRWSSRAMGPAGAELVETIARVNGRLVRRYFFAKLITGAVSGTATAVFLWAMGVPMPLVWGLLALLMNFIPNVGAVISAVPPTLLALFELGIAEGLIVAGGLLVIESLVGNLLDPLIQGDALDLSPFVVVLSLLFWGWLWGIVGAVMAPTLTAAIVSVWKQVGLHRRLGAVSDGESGGSPDGRAIGSG